MTGRKFTDEQIIKALECCSSAECEKCEYEPHGDCYRGSFACNDDLMRTALDLIKRQKAEVAYWQDEAANAKKEAVKEFAERLKKYYASLGGKTVAVGVEYHVDQIAREVLAREEKEGE